MGVGTEQGRDVGCAVAVGVVGEGVDCVAYGGGNGELVGGGVVLYVLVEEGCEVVANYVRDSERLEREQCVLQ